MQARPNSRRLNLGRPMARRETVAGALNRFVEITSHCPTVPKRRVRIPISRCCSTVRRPHALPASNAASSWNVGRRSDSGISSASVPPVLDGYRGAAANSDDSLGVPNGRSLAFGLLQENVDHAARSAGASADAKDDFPGPGHVTAQKMARRYPDQLRGVGCNNGINRTLAVWPAQAQDVGHSAFDGSSADQAGP